MATNDRYYEYLNDSWAWYNPVQDLFLLRPSQANAVSGAQFHNSSYYDVVTTPEYDAVKTELINMRGGTRLVIGGTSYNGYNGYVLYYDAETSQKAAYAVNFAADGEIDFSNNAGAGNIRSGYSTDPADSDIQLLQKVGIYVSNTLDITDGWRLYDGYTILSSHNTDAFGIYAAGEIKVNGSLNARIETHSDNNLMANYQNMTGDKPAWVDIASGNTARSAAFRVGSLTVEKDFTAQIESTVDNYVGRVKKAVTISGNTIAAYGIWANEAITINGLWSSEGIIFSSANGTSLGNVLDDMERDDSGAITGAKNISITNNAISAIGIQGGDITLGSAGKYVRDENGIWTWLDAGSITTEVIDTEFFWNVLSTDDGSYTVTGNTIESMAISGKSLTVNESFEANLNTTISGINIDFESISVGKKLTTSWSNSITQAGILLSNKLVSLSNFGGMITVDYDNDASYGFSKITDLDIYGISAPTISVNAGVFRSNITLNTQGVSTNPKSAMVTSYVVGIKTDNFSTDAFTGSINSYVGSNNTTINCGIFVNGDLTNTNDGTFDITGSINVFGGTYSIGIMGGNSRGHNLRISGSIATSAYAIVAGEITSSFLYAQSSQNDRVYVAAGAYVQGAIELGNGQNTLIVDSNARLYSALYSSGGTINLEFVLNSTPMSGVTLPVAQQAIIRSYGSSLADETNVTVNLNSATTGDYVLYQNTDLSNWEMRTINFKYQGIDKEYAIANGLTITTDARLGYAEFSNSGLSGKIAANGGLCVVKDSGGRIVLEITSEIVGNQVVFHVNEIPLELPVKKLADIESDSLSMVRNENERTMTVSWTDSDKNSAQDYELEYRLVTTDLSNGQTTVGKSIVQTVSPSKLTWNSTQNCYVSSDGRVTMTTAGKVSVQISGLDPDTTIEWRVRQNQGNGDLVSGWTDFSGTPILDSYNWVCAKPESATFVLGKSGASAMAELTWEAGEVTEGVKLYRLRYFQSVVRLEGDDAFWENMWNNVAYIEKQVTSNSLLVSGLNNQEYFYWQVQTEDQNGNVSDWTTGELLRVYTDDTTPPVFSEKPTSSVIYVTPSPQPDPFTVTTNTLDLTLNWKAATDDRSGVSRYTVSWKLASDTDWTTVDISVTDENRTNYQFRLSDYADLVANGSYQWQITASDYVGRTSAAQTGTWTTDTTSPIFDTGSVEYVSVWESSSRPLSISVAWDPAEDEEGGSGLYYYQLRYRSSTSGSWTVVNLPTSDLSISLSLVNAAYYDYEVSAFDVAGNQSSVASGIWYGDSIAPTFDDTSEITVDNSYKVATKSSVLLFNWSTATDSSLGPVSGMKNYELAYYNKDNQRIILGTYEEGTLSTEIIVGKGGITGVDDGYYSWSITAYDNAGNGNEYFGEDFLIDTKAPTGNFNFPAFQGHATYENITIPGSSDSVIPAFGSPPVSTGTTVTEILITDIWETFTFNGDFTDESGKVFYELQISNSSTFSSQTDRVYSFVTDQESLTLNSTNGLGAGALANCDLIHWRVRAVDSSGNYGGWYTGRPFLFVDDVTGEPIYIADTVAPTLIESTNISVTNKNNVNTVTANWSSSYDLFGVQFYEISFTVGKKTNTILVDAENTSAVFKFTNGNADGRYSWKIRAVDYVGNKSNWTSGDQFLVDTIDPSFDTSSLKIVGVQGAQDIGLGWKIATDANFYGYQIEMLSQNHETSYVMTSQNSYWFYNQTNGLYSFRVRAVDTLGNTSEWSDSRKFMVDTTADPGSTFETAAPLAFTGSRETMVGGSDSADMFKLTLSNAAAVTITLAGVETLEGKNSGVKVYVYDSNHKKLKSISVKSGTKSLDVLLDAVAPGTNYYVEVVSASGNASVAKYTISATKEDFETPSSNRDWTSAEAIALTGGSGSVADGWVGFGDAADYYKFTADFAGSISIDFSGIGSATSLKVSLYALVDGKYKQMASTTVKYDTDNIFRKNVLAHAGEYYLVVESGDKGKGKYNSDYDFSIDDSYYQAPSDNSDWDSADEIALTGGSGSVADGWVGFGDPADYYRFNTTAAGAVNVDISGLDPNSSLKVSLYTLVDGKYKKMASVTVKSDMNDIFKKDVLAQAGEYYLVVESGDKGKGKFNSYYDMTVNDDYFPVEATPNDILANAEEKALVSGGMNTDVSGWVGFGDPADCYLLTADGPGSVNFSFSVLEAGMKIQVSLYDLNGKKIKSYTVTDKKPLLVENMLLANDCYLVVESGDKGKGKFNTEYLGSVVYSEFPTEATSNNTLASAFEAANTVNFTGAVAEANDWVGYGDNIDFFAFELDASGRVDLDLALGNAGLRVGKEVKVKLYTEDGKLLKLDSGLMSNELEAGKYAVSVEITKPEKNWTGYDLGITKLA